MTRHRPAINSFMPQRMEVPEVPENSRLICFKPFAFMFAKWMRIGSVMYVCHYIFPHLFDDFTETNGCSQGQSSVGQSLLCKSGVPHLTPCSSSQGCVCPQLTSLPPGRPQALFEQEASAQADLQGYCILKLHLLHSPGPLQSFPLGFLSFRACCSWTCITPWFSMLP